MTDEDAIRVELRERGGLREITPAMRRSRELAEQGARRSLPRNLFIFGVVLVVLVALVWAGRIVL